MRAMKDSGIAWIGEIPEGWKYRTVGALTKIRTGDSNTQDAEPYGSYPFYVRSPVIKRSNSFTFDGTGVLMSGDGAGAGRIFHIVSGKFCCHQRVYFIQPKETVELKPYFLYYWLVALFSLYIKGGSAKSTVDSVRLPMIKSFPIFLPPLEEQQRIADYLDQKCAEIEQAIISAEQAIQEYGAYKQSLIFQATTKGLDPSVPLKDSGIAWIGEIPAGWGVGRLKSMLSLSRVINKSDAKVLSLYRDYGIIPKDSRNDNHNVTSLDTTKYKFVEVGDFVINKMKAWQGSMALSTYEGIVSPAYHVLKFVSSRIEPRYAHMILRTKPYAQEWDRLSTGLRVGQWDLHVEDFLNTRLPLPPLDEQQRIADYLDQKCAEIERAIEAKKAIIKDLKLYKQSLIFEVTTGKKEV